MTNLPVVLFLHPSDELYGADRSLRSLVLGVRDVVRPIVVLPRDLPYRGELSSSLRAEGVEVVFGPVPVVRRRYLTRLRLAPWAFRTFLAIVQLTMMARRRRVAGLVSNTTAVTGGPVVARLVGVPHMWYVREIVESPKWYRAMVRGLSLVARGQVIAVSRAVARWLGDIPGRGPLILHNGVDVYGEPRPLPEQPRALFVGRFNNWKGHEIFMEAASLAHERVPTATFALVGGAVPVDPETTKATESRARALDPDGAWLQLVGEVPESREAMRDSWLVVVPSTLPDPFPNVVLEAMAEGRAVVGSNLGGIPEMVVAGRTGDLVMPRNAVSLANALARILEDRELAVSMGREGRNEVDRRFSRDRMRSDWRDLLLAAISQRAVVDRT